MRLIDILYCLFCGGKRHMGAARILPPRREEVFLAGKPEYLLKS
jgi:hypothetical protein